MFITKVGKAKADHILALYFYIFCQMIICREIIVYI